MKYIRNQSCDFIINIYFTHNYDIKTLEKVSKTKNSFDIKPIKMWIQT